MPTGGGTDVEVVTDLAITGKPAQFGRGVMQDVSDKLLGQFVTCLEQRLGDDGSAEAETEDAPAAAAAAAGPQSVAAPTPEAGEPAPAAAPPRPRPVAAAPPPQDDALDLGAAVLPVLAKGYWKQGVGAAAVVALIVWLIRRK